MAHLDSVEVLDPADTAAHHAQQPLRFLPLAPRPVRPAEDADARGERVGRAELLVELHQATGDGRQPAVLALHLVQPAAQLAGQDVDAVADADDGLLGGGGAVELRLETDQGGAQQLAQFRLEVGTDLRALVDGGQDVVDGLTGTQLGHRVGQLLVREPCDGGELVGQLLLPDLGLVGELGLVGRGLLGQPFLVRPGLVGELRLVRGALVGQAPLVRGVLLAELGLQAGAIGGELSLQAGHVLLPLLVVLGLCGAERGFIALELSAGAQQQAYAHGTGRRRRDTGDGRGDPLRAHERGGNCPASQAQRHQPPAVPGDRGPRRRWRSGEFHLHPSKQHDRTGGCVNRTHEYRTASRLDTVGSTRSADRNPIGFGPARINRAGLPEVRVPSRFGRRLQIDK